MTQDLFIVGATGGVGKTLIEQVINKEDCDPVRHPNPSRIVGLASRDQFIYQANGLELNELYAFRSREHPSPTPYSSLQDLVQSVQNNLPSGNLVFIDVTDGRNDLLRFHQSVIKQTEFALVTANKNPLTFCTYEEFEELTAQVRRYRFSCSVMAGAESITVLQKLQDLNDPVARIEGCFSGTLGYLLSQLEAGYSFSEALADAMKQGFTEPDPREDLNGYDVAKKLVILARSAGFPINFDQVKVEPFIPPEYLTNEPLEEFLKRITPLDNAYAARFLRAHHNKSTLRYVALFEPRENKIEVGLKEVPLSTPIGQLAGKMNKIVIISETHTEDCPKGLEGPGAGQRVTAQNIRGDLLDLLERRIIRKSKR